MSLLTPTGAVINGDIDALQTFVNREPALATMVDVFGQSLLMQAAFHAQTEAVRFLLPLSQVHQQDATGDTAFLLACRASSFHGTPMDPEHILNCVQLLASVSDPRHANQHGQTALMLAACEGHDRVLKYLLPLSEVAALDHQGRDACAWALQYHRATCVARLLPFFDPQRTQDALTKIASPKHLLEALATVECQDIQSALQGVGCDVAHSSARTSRKPIRSFRL